MSKVNGNVVPFPAKPKEPPVTGYVFLLELEPASAVPIYYSRGEEGGQTALPDRATRFKLKQDAEFAAEALSGETVRWIVREHAFG